MKGSDRLLCTMLVHEGNAVLDCGYIYIYISRYHGKMGYHCGLFVIYIYSTAECDSLLPYEVHLLRVPTGPSPQEGALPLQHTLLESLTTEEQSQPNNI